MYSNECDTKDKNVGTIPRSIKTLNNQIQCLVIPAYFYKHYF